MRRLVECVPNFSEGRDSAKVEAIVAAMREVPGVLVLAHESDADHNRSVVTIAGEPDIVVEAAVRAVGKAAELIDLTKQVGVHPRIGSADVVPFVPLEGVTLQDCVALAKLAGGEIWRRYRVPVYFYEAAAQRPDRVNLENIRRGQFEALRQEIASNPDRAPDIGERAVHPTAGATVVGARKFLIAYNILLNTRDVEVAKKIAKAVRFSSGGLRYVKAMGVYLDARNLAQVSMNLTDFEQTPLHRVFEMVKNEAERYGTSIASSEIIGLIPRRAIDMAAEHLLRIENFTPSHVLEKRLEDALAAGATARAQSLAAMIEPFLAAVAQPTVAPGGGSVAAIAGALAAGLGQMVAGLSSQRKAQAEHAARLERLFEQFQIAVRDLPDLIDQDAGAFEAVMTARKLPRESAHERQARNRTLQQALQRAAAVPLEVARRSADLFEWLGQLKEMASPSMLSDVHVGRLMAFAAVRGALENVGINLEEIEDIGFVERSRADARAIGARVNETQVTAEK
ncbi:MAG: glutamate formimidoyltransferase [Acidobacteriota bacterium]|nr:glutamate formimidoyltransferase [Acidobacteriota bacterium]